MKGYLLTCQKRFFFKNSRLCSLKSTTICACLWWNENEVIFMIINSRHWAETIEWIPYYLLKYRANTDDYVITRLTVYQDFTFIISWLWEAILNTYLWVLIATFLWLTYLSIIKAFNVWRNIWKKCMYWLLI